MQILVTLKAVHFRKASILPKCKLETAAPKTTSQQ